MRVTAIALAVNALAYAMLVVLIVRDHEPAGDSVGVAQDAVIATCNATVLANNKFWEENANSYLLSLTGAGISLDASFDQTCPNSVLYGDGFHSVPAKDDKLARCIASRNAGIPFYPRNLVGGSAEDMQRFCLEHVSARDVTDFLGYASCPQYFASVASTVVGLEKCNIDDFEKACHTIENWMRLEKRVEYCAKMPTI